MLARHLLGKMVSALPCFSEIHLSRKYNEENSKNENRNKLFFLKSKENLRYQRRSRNVRVFPPNFSLYDLPFTGMSDVTIQTKSKNLLASVWPFLKFGSAQTQYRSRQHSSTTPCKEHKIIFRSPF